MVVEKDKITWNVEDVREALTEAGYAPTGLECELVMARTASAMASLLRGTAKSEAIALDLRKDEQQ